RVVDARAGVRRDRRRPLADRDVVGVAGLPVRTEREDRVGPYAGSYRGEPADRLVRLDLGAAAVGIVEPVVLGDAEVRERPGQLLGADLSKSSTGGVLPLVGRAELAARRGDDDDPITAGDRVGHEPRAQVGLVVRVRPDGEDRAEVIHPEIL